MITLSLTLQAPRNIRRELLPSGPEPALKPGQALDRPVSISRALLHPYLRASCSTFSIFMPSRYMKTKAPDEVKL